MRETIGSVNLGNGGKKKLLLGKHHLHISSSSKHVSFVEKLVKDSPAKKSVPPESPNTIKFGTLNFHADNPSVENLKSQASNPSVKFSNLNSNSNSNHGDIPARKVFGRIKAGLIKLQNYHCTFPTSDRKTQARVHPKISTFCGVDGVSGSVIPVFSVKIWFAVVGALDTSIKKNPVSNSNGFRHHEA
jgi:hypothetical protein